MGHIPDTKALFKTDRFVNGFCPSCVSGHSSSTQHLSEWADFVEKVVWVYALGMVTAHILLGSLRRCLLVILWLAPSA